VSVPELAAFIKSKAKGDKELATELRQAAIVHLERVNPEIATLVREHRTKSRARVSWSGDCGGDLIKRDMEDAWEAVAAKFSHVMVSTPADVKQMAMFTPEDAPQLAERLREVGNVRDVNDIASNLRDFLVVQGRPPFPWGEEASLARDLSRLQREYAGLCRDYSLPSSRSLASFVPWFVSRCLSTEPRGDEHVDVAQRPKGQAGRPRRQRKLWQPPNLTAQAALNTEVINRLLRDTLADAFDICEVATSEHLKAEIDAGCWRLSEAGAVRVSYLSWRRLGRHPISVEVAQRSVGRPQKGLRPFSRAGVHAWQ